MPNGRLFQRAFPTAIALGMTPGQYWHEDPMLYCAFAEAQRLRDEAEDWRRWQSGAYAYQALLRTAPTLNALSKSSEPMDWLDAPFGRQEEPDEEVARANEQADHQRMIDWMLAHSPE
nr:hypothetical protein [uncultured Olsenella sp.]